MATLTQEIMLLCMALQHAALTAFRPKLQTYRAHPNAHRHPNSRMRLLSGRDEVSHLVRECGVVLLRAPAPLGLRSVSHAAHLVRLRSQQRG